MEIKIMLNYEKSEGWGSRNYITPHGKPGTCLSSYNTGTVKSTLSYMLKYLFESFAFADEKHQFRLPNILRH